MTILQLAAVIVPALFLGGFIKGAIGFGLPLVATPVLLFYLPLPQVVALIFVPVLLSNIQQCWLTRAASQVVRIVWPLLVVNGLVLLLGSHLIVVMEGGVLRSIVGCLIIMHALLPEGAAPRGVAIPVSRLTTAAVGAVSGALGSVSSFYSFPGVQLLHSMRLEPAAFVFAVGLFMVTGFVALWFGLLLHGAKMTAHVEHSMLAVAPVVVGMWFGNKTRDLLSHGRFRAMVRGMLLLVGMSLVVRGL